MSTFFSALLSASLSMSAVIVLLLLLNKLSDNKIPATYRYYVWLIVLAGLLIPFRPNFSTSVIPLQIPIVEVMDAFSVVHERIYGEIRSNAAIKLNAIAGLPIVAPAAEKSSASYVLVLFGIWITGALAILVFHFFSYCRFVSAIRRWSVEAEDKQLLSVMRSVQESMGFHGEKITVKTCSFVPTPVLIGFFNPVILLPEKEISSDELEYILRHELTHYKRKDLWINILILLVSAMHWFNPFVYLMARAIRTDCETACDETVVFGNDIEWRKNYGEAIISFIGMSNAKAPVLSSLSTYFYGGSKSMKKRLVAIMDIEQKNKGLASAFVAVGFVAILVFGNIVTVSASTVTGLPKYRQQVHLPHPTQSQQQAVPSSTIRSISEVEAKSIALSFVELAESEVGQMNVWLKKENKASAYYEVKFYHGLIKYEVEVFASDGAIRELEVDYTNTVNRTTGSGNYIGEANAKSIALSLVGVSEAEVSGIKVKFYNKNNKPAYYEVEFYKDRIEYEYKLDAFNGAVRKVSIDYKYNLNR